MVHDSATLDTTRCGLPANPKPNLPYSLAPTPGVSEHYEVAFEAGYCQDLADSSGKSEAVESPQMTEVSQGLNRVGVMAEPMAKPTEELIRCVE